MIKDLYVKIPTKGCRKLKKFEELGYDINADFIDLKVSDLNIGSRQIVSVECDFCNKIVSITYKEYLRNISIGNRYACSKNCGSIKARHTNLEKYGVDYPMMLDEMQNKVKNTNIERYGVEFLQQSDIFRDRTKKTFYEKYGVDSFSKTSEFLDKFKNTNKERHGVEFPSQSMEIREKSKKTWILNLGFDNPSKSIEVRNRAKNTNIERYGNEIPIRLDEFKYKTANTNQERYGVSNPMKSDLLRKDRYSITSDDRLIKYLDGGKSLMRCDLSHEFVIHIDNYIKRSMANLPICTICNPIGDSRSIKENELHKFISENYNGEVIKSYRDGLEIDIYLPELKIGFEFNGLYWHSEKYKEKNYHLEKTKYFNYRGIRIIHIWEDDWIFREEILKSQIKNCILIKSEKIFARKCEIRHVNISECRDFLNKNHIQGADKSRLKFGLFYNNELVSLMTFDRFEGRKKMEEGGWNLSRFCNRLNTSVIGGASKLLKYFICNYCPTRIVSYADRDWSKGNLYYKLGFENIKESKPDYKYVVGGKRVHKSNFKRACLKTDLTETEQMKVYGFNKIWDCGKIKFEMKVNKTFML